MTDIKKVNQATQMLEQGVKAIFESGQYKKWLSVCSRFHSYSVNNCILILLQAPYATQVAGYQTWKSLGRQVKKGEHGIRIIAPIRIRSPTKNINSSPEEELEEPLRFKLTTVFDISQTSGPELPTLTHVLTGNSKSYDLLFQDLTAVSPLPVRITDELPGNTIMGCCDGQIIKVRKSISGQQKCKTLVHEITHALCDTHSPNNDSRETKEVRAESVAYIVCSYFQIDTSEYSFGYIAGWSTGKELKELLSELNKIKQTACSIIKNITTYQKEKIAAS